MNIIFAIVLAFLFFLIYATDIDYVEHTTRQKIIGFSVQLAVLVVLIITAICFYKPNTLLRMLNVAL